MQEKHCIDCGKVLTGHGKSIRCHRCAAIHWRAPSKKTIPTCTDCGCSLSKTSVYRNPVPRRCPICSGIARRGRVSNWLGKTHSQETIKKMRVSAISRGIRPPSTTGLKKTAEQIIKISGPNNHGWKGGISKDRDKVERTEAYKLWRTQVFANDDYTCVSCGVRGGMIHAHHILSFAKHPKLRTTTSNGATMCVVCHRKLHRQLTA
jgi:hypothetical protein